MFLKATREHSPDNRPQDIALVMMAASVGSRIEFKSKLRVLFLYLIEWRICKIELDF
jgi:hypothetical protein